jgi:putative FmdB family regulatory protein
MMATFESRPDRTGRQHHGAVMPTYQFRCPDCAVLFEEKRAFARADEPAICPGCGSARPSKVFASAMFYAPGSAAKAMLEPGAKKASAPVSHGAGCPCCSGQTA